MTNKTEDLNNNEIRKLGLFDNQDGTDLGGMTREELEAAALEAIPTEDYYDLLDNVGGETDETLREIIRKGETN